jgi:hypothetical protein
VFLLNSRLSLFTVTLEGLHPQEYPFSLSYGAILPSSLTRVHSSASGYSPRLPVSVYGTVTNKASSDDFSRHGRLDQFILTVVSTPRNPSPSCEGLRSRTGISNTRMAYLHASSPDVKRFARGCRMLTACPSLTPIGLSLGPTHPGWINLPQETLGFRRIRFSRIFSLLIPASSLLLRPAALTRCLHPTTERSPTTMQLRRAAPSAASAVHLAPIIIGAESLDR